MPNLFQKEFVMHNKLYKQLQAQRDVGEMDGVFFILSLPTALPKVISCAS